MSTIKQKCKECDDFFEIDIWFDNDYFVTMYYKFDGTFRRYETNDF